MIKLFLTDVDGCLTDGVYQMTEEGRVAKNFYSRDFHGLFLLHESGVKIAAITTSKDFVIIKQCERAAKYVKLYTGVKDKVKIFQDEICKDYSNISLRIPEIAFMGDDIVDLPLLKLLGREGGLPTCPADAGYEVLEYVRHEAENGYVSEYSGGRGCVREVVDFILDTNKQGI